MTKKQSAGPSSDRNVVRNAKARTSHRTFYIALAAIVLLGVVVLGYVWRRSQQASATTTIAADSGATLTAVGYVRGSPDAPIEIIEFGDFECPGCAQFAIETEPRIRTELIETGIARFRFFDLQVNQTHQNSPAASVAAGCANDQGKFWEMHDRLFAGQGEWSTVVTLQPKPILQGYAQQIGLDATAWEECFDARRHLETIAVNAQQAKRLGLRFTPSILIGNRLLTGAQPFGPIKAAVDSALAETKAAVADTTKPKGG